MRYSECLPRPSLAAFVRCVWRFESEDVDLAPQGVVPDGCSELIVHLKAPYAESAGDGPWIVQASTLFAGQLTRPLHLKPTGPVSVAAVRFQPAGARRFVGAPLNKFTDLRTSLVELHGKRATADLIHHTGSAQDDDALWVALQDYVEAHLAQPPRDEALVMLVVDRLARSGGRSSMAELAIRTGLTSRTLERRFLDVVGVSPRSLASVFRLRGFFAALEASPGADLTELALAAQWFDHSQMSRDFRRFLGCTPSAFLRSGPGLAASLATGTADALSETYKQVRRPRG